MTECERFVAEGELPMDFFQEEVRNDFLVDTERKKLWAVELDMLIQLDRVCRKHDLHYVLWSGTLLGAVRHQGFIPWDDDLDVAMLREDYEKLLALADEFEDPYLLQTPHTDPEAGYSHAKLRNSRTTAFNKLWSYRNYNFGIYIDIFPMDRFVLDGRVEMLEEIERLAVDNSLWMKMPSPYKNAWDEFRISQHSGRSIKENYDRIQALAMQNADTDTDRVAFSLKKSKKPERFELRTCFTDTIMMPFEGFNFPGPKAYDAVLKKSYGDYMEFPPLEKRVNKHEHTIFDPDTPYKLFEFPPYEPYCAYIEYGKKMVENI